MSALTILMYCMSTVHITLSIRAAVRAFFLQHEGESEKDPTVWVQLLLEFLNVGLASSFAVAFQEF